MNKETILGIVRHMLTFGGGFLVASGHIDQPGMMELVAAVITLAGGIWSILAKKKPAAPAA